MNPIHTDINAQRQHSFANPSFTDPSSPQAESENPQKPTTQVFRFRDSTHSGGSDPESPQTGYFPNENNDESADQDEEINPLAQSTNPLNSDMAHLEFGNTSTNPKKMKGEMVFHIEGEDSESNGNGNDLDSESSPEVRPRARNDRVVYSPKGTMIGTRPPQLKDDSDEEEEEYHEAQPRSRNTRVVFSPRGDANKNTEIETNAGVTVKRTKDNLAKSFVGTKGKSDVSGPNSFIGDTRKSTGTHSFISSQTDERKSIIISGQNKFTDKSQWSENLKCCVCCRVFDKTQGVNTHHCRACGKAVCGDCSRKKINNDRACDICYKKAVDATGEATRSNRLLAMMAKLQAKERYLDEMKQSLNDLQKKKKEMEKIWMNELNDKANLSRVLQDERRQEREELEKKRLENDKLKQDIEANNKFIKEREEENNEVQEILSTVKSELFRQKNLKNAKIQEYEQLAEGRRGYNQSVLSIVRVSIANEASFLQAQTQN